MIRRPAFLVAVLVVCVVLAALAPGHGLGRWIAVALAAAVVIVVNRIAARRARR